MTFNIQMWNEEIQLESTGKIKEIVPTSSIPIEVQILPYEKIWLTSSIDHEDCISSMLNFHHLELAQIDKIQIYLLIQRDDRRSG